MTDQPPIRFAFYVRVGTQHEQDPEAAREQRFRCRAIIESLGWQNIAPYLDSGESPYHPADQREPKQEKPIP